MAFADFFKKLKGSKPAVRKDDFGYAVIIDVDYSKNHEHHARQFFKLLSDYLLAKGFNFESRIFYRIGTFSGIENEIREALTMLKLSYGYQPSQFIRTAHIIPLSQFTDLTPSLITI